MNLTDKATNEKIDISKAKILYSSTRKDKQVSFRGNIDIQVNEILILEKIK